MAELPLGIYIHIPFCASRCSYCDFCSLAAQEELMPKYQTALLAHIKESAPRLSHYAVDTVYFGGGTPSIYDTGDLIKLLQCIKRNYKLRLGAEITLEANPDSIELSELKRLRRAGFNRISIGIQSANDAILKLIGRRHNFAQAEKAVKTARAAGFENISADLIFGLPGQTRGDWAETLNRTAALNLQHISCYALKIEPGTMLYNMQNRLQIPDDDTQADMYLYAVDSLSGFGLKQYEISNFAMRGMESRHNLKYWQLGDYAGFGASAHSLIGNMRFAFTKDVRAYIRGITSSGEVVSEKEEINDFERVVEYIMLGLRTVHGICESEYYNIYHITFTPLARQLEEFAKNGWARKNGERWCFTPQGFLISNRLIGKLLEIVADLKRSVATPWKMHTSLHRYDDEDIQLHL